MSKTIVGDFEFPNNPLDILIDQDQITLCGVWTDVYNLNYSSFLSRHNEDKLVWFTCPGQRSLCVRLGDHSSKKVFGDFWSYEIRLNIK